MDKYDLFNSINEVDDCTLLSTEQTRTYRIQHPVIKTIAACLALIICGFGLYYYFSKPDTNGASAPWFAITAYAENGVKKDLYLNQSFLSSCGSETNIFGNDKPLFNFDIQPKKAAEDQDAFSIYDCEIFVSYNDNKLDYCGDDHIFIAYTMPVAGYPGYPGYAVLGWFEEPTTITVSISDGKTGALLEEYTVHIQPLTESEMYELTVLEIKTYYQT